MWVVRLSATPRALCLKDTFYAKAYGGVNTKRIEKNTMKQVRLPRDGSFSSSWWAPKVLHEKSSSTLICFETVCDRRILSRTLLTVFIDICPKIWLFTCWSELFRTKYDGQMRSLANTVGYLSSSRTSCICFCEH
jgi:hypothetical protein